MQFFKRSSHCKPDVLQRITADIDTLTNSLQLLRRIGTWGSLEQTKMCLYGGLPVSFPRKILNMEEKESYVLPFQIWLTHQFPIDPPMVFIVGIVGVDGDYASMWSCSQLQIASNHPNVDVTGLCFCKALHEWLPRESSLCLTVECLCHEIERSGVCPVYIGKSRSVPRLDVNTSSENECVICYGLKDTVLVPCGHHCLCEGCASNILDCPICRTKIMVRQRIFR